jgi:hypothetical protein
LRNLNDSKFINRADVEEYIKISAKENLGLHKQKHHKPWLGEESLQCLDQRKKAKVKWLQGPNKINVDNINNVRCADSRHFRKKERIFKN